MEEELKKIKKQVTQCTKCELSETRNNSVPGKGNFKSDVIFVGEAPGKNEDMKGEPFIGIAGKKLSMALASFSFAPPVGLFLASFFVTFSLY